MNVGFCHFRKGRVSGNILIVFTFSLKNKPILNFDILEIVHSNKPRKTHYLVSLFKAMYLDCPGVDIPDLSSPGEPNSFQGTEEDCAAFDFIFKYKWVDISCQSQLFYICEIPYVLYIFFYLRNLVRFIHVLQFAKSRMSYTCS